MKILSKFITHFQRSLENFRYTKTLTVESYNLNIFLYWFSIYRFLGFMPIFRKSSDKIVIRWPSYRVLFGIGFSFVHGIVSLKNYQTVYNNILTKNKFSFRDYFCLFQTCFPFSQFLIWCLVLLVKSKEIFHFIDKWTHIELSLKSYGCRVRCERFGAIILIVFPLFIVTCIGWMNVIFGNNAWKRDETKLIQVFRQFLETFDSISIFVSYWSITFLAYMLMTLLQTFNKDLSNVCSALASGQKLKERRQLHIEIWMVVKLFNSIYGILASLNVINSLLELFCMVYFLVEHSWTYYVAVFILATIMHNFIYVSVLVEIGQQISHEV